MAKKTKKKKPSKSKKLSVKLVKQIQYLKLLKQVSLNAADGKSEQLDSLFTSQADKIQHEIEKLKDNQ